MEASRLVIASERLYGGLLLSLLRCRSCVIPTWDLIRPAQLIWVRLLGLNTAADAAAKQQIVFIRFYSPLEKLSRVVTFG